MSNRIANKTADFDASSLLQTNDLSRNLKQRTTTEPTNINLTDATAKRSDQQFQGSQLRKKIEGLWADKVNETDSTIQTNKGIRSKNPNGIVNAVENATGIARVFGNVGEKGQIGHDGIHVVAPVGSKITVLPALEGKVVDIHDQGDGSFALEVAVNKRGQKPFIVIYKDISIDPKIARAVKRGEHPVLKAGDVIGKTTDGGEGMGVHIALLRGGQKEHDYYRLQTRTIYSLNDPIVELAVKRNVAKKADNPKLAERYEAQRLKLEQKQNQATMNIQASLFIDPLDAEESPIACPDIKADPSNVEPYKKPKGIK